MKTNLVHMISDTKFSANAGWHRDVPDFDCLGKMNVVSADFLKCAQVLSITGCAVLKSQTRFEKH